MQQCMQSKMGPYNYVRWPSFDHDTSQGKTATIHQVTTMLATSENVLFPGYNQVLTTSADDPTL